MRGSWRPNRTAIYWPPLLWPSALCLSRSPGLLNRRPGGLLSSGGYLSRPHLVTNGSGLQTNWLPVFTELYNSSIAHSIFGMACLIVIKRKKLSCSSQVTHFRCISLWLYCGILTLSPIVSQVRPRQWNMQLPRLWYGMFGRVEGQYTTFTLSKKINWFYL